MMSGDDFATSFFVELFAIDGSGCASATVLGE
jgi:hypothetical protein